MADGEQGTTEGGQRINESGTPAVEPMSVQQLGRWFLLPLLIVAGIVGGAVTVVLLFGAPASQSAHSVEELLTSLESSSGAKNMGMLLPRDKALWQTGLELTLRLRKKHEGEGMSDDQLALVAQRVGAMVEKELSGPDFQGPSGADMASPETRTPTRLEFLIRSLGLTERPEAVEPLIKVLRSGNELYAVLAIQQLGNLASLKESKEAVGPMVELLKSSDHPEVQLTACTALSVMATPKDAPVISAIRDVALTHEGEVAWAAALALARLGNDDGKSTLLDMLDRPYWESGDRYRIVDATGAVEGRPMPPGRIDQLLIAAIDAASNLGDPDLWNGIDQLKSDPSAEVRAVAARASAKRLD